MSLLKWMEACIRGGLFFICEELYAVFVANSGCECSINMQ